MNYGFVIDNRKCIGCHACSTACKSENQVPLGVNRTWVKYVEQGQYPDARRSFQVSRCNHCENPPCVRICPVTAMYQRDDGIVEFDGSACIGCKACMQACPYDAIYIDPDTHTAAKCHFCAHRLEVDLEPACVVVCPEHAIISGDMDDPTSEISRMIAKNQTTVRKPEQGTAPKVLYIEGNSVSLHPTAISGAPETFLFSDVVTQQGAEPSPSGPGEERRAPTGQTIRSPRDQGVPPGGPIQVGQGRMAEQMVQIAWNAQHEIPWHWPVPAYLVTKGIGAGAFMMLALGAGFGMFDVSSGDVAALGALGVLATLVTTALLVADLERPERFLSILTRPQWKSWLTRGAFILIAFSTVTGIWWALEGAVWLFGWSLPAALRYPLAWLSLPLGVGAAVYTAFLFAQAEGRDLWQSPLLPVHLLVQAVMMGGAGALLLGGLGWVDAALLDAARWAFGGAVLADLFVTLGGEFGIPHASEVAARAAHSITHGRYKNHFWWGYVGLGHALALLLVLPGVPALGAAAALAAMVGLYLYEYAFVMAPQEIPNS